MGRKLDAKWNGPYMVFEKISRGRYRWNSLVGTILKKINNGAQLKDYQTPCSGPDNDIHVSQFLFIIFYDIYRCIHIRARLLFLDMRFLPVISRHTVMSLLPVMRLLLEKMTAATLRDRKR